MKIVKYILNADGSIPTWVIDGGYFGKPNGGVSPRDIDYIGIVIDSSPNPAFTRVELRNYVKEFNATMDVLDYHTMVKTTVSTDSLIDKILDDSELNG